MMERSARSSAARSRRSFPYYVYARQDRKDKPRVPILAKLVANLFTRLERNRVLTMDLHKAQIQGFFDIPVDHLFAAPVIIEYCARLGMPNLTIVSPDAGGRRPPARTRSGSMPSWPLSQAPQRSTVGPR